MVRHTLFCIIEWIGRCEVGRGSAGVALLGGAFSLLTPSVARNLFTFAGCFANRSGRNSSIAGSGGGSTRTPLLGNNTSGSSRLLRSSMRQVSFQDLPELLVRIRQGRVLLDDLYVVDFRANSVLCQIVRDVPVLEQHRVFLGGRSVGRRFHLSNDVSPVHHVVHGPSRVHPSPDAPVGGDNPRHVFCRIDLVAIPRWGRVAAADVVLVPASVVIAVVVRRGTNLLHIGEHPLPPLLGRCAVRFGRRCPATG
mmetsp:Transcript_8577/g.24059  ORF Transcript_8577/g.24059 Transcript_8577/m.24059 type:complete len:252 (-) Transcript_8577:995-1750(-)